MRKLLSACGVLGVVFMLSACYTNITSPSVGFDSPSGSQASTTTVSNETVPLDKDELIISTESTSETNLAVLEPETKNLRLLWGNGA